MTTAIKPTRRELLRLLEQRQRARYGQLIHEASQRYQEANQRLQEYKQAHPLQPLLQALPLPPEAQRLKGRWEALGGTVSAHHFQSAAGPVARLTVAATQDFQLRESRHHREVAARTAELERESHLAWTEQRRLSQAMSSAMSSDIYEAALQRLPEEAGPLLDRLAELLAAAVEQESAGA